MRNIILFFFILFFFTSNATNLKLSQPILYTDNGQSYALLNISWENTWYNTRNHDGVWLFFKFLQGNNGCQHPKVVASGHEVVTIHDSKNLNLEFEVPKDRLGLFLHPAQTYRGKVEATIKISLDKESFERVNTRSARFSVYGIEMVFIPEGGFTLGDPDTSALAFGSLYQSDTHGNYKGLFEVETEDQLIEVAPKEDALYYRAPEGYEGDQKGIIPASFPKGVAPFYMMKYEPTQGQYADFLNSLSQGQSQNRVNFGGKDYYQERGSIVYENLQYVARKPSAPCNFMSWDDAMAYADWAGLRPMTELEFTKACRGPGKPTAQEFPWNTDSKMSLQRFVNEEGLLVQLNAWEESKLSEESRAIFGASHYWVMDLAGSLWERVVSIGHPKGRAFTGSHGDGVLTEYGFANNEDWPKGIGDEGGFGFRGGGFYGYGRDYHDFNPFSPIAYRTYGGWAGWNRVNAYGARFVRTGL